MNEAAEVLGAHDVQLILPMEMCSWLLTEPWPGRRRPGAQALAFAVEDQLADDLDELHIAVGPLDAQRRYPLLVINRQRFKNVLAQLQARGLNIASAYVDADLLPREQPSIAWWDGRWLAGGALDLRLALTPQALEVLKDGPLGMAVEHTFDLGSVPLGAINLLQGEYRRTSQRLPWRGVSVAALLIVADVVVEAFACKLPEGYLQAMKARETPALWINLEYLSAEDWPIQTMRNKNPFCCN